MSTGKTAIILRSFGFLGFLLLAQGVFAAVPIQERSLVGAAAADARLRLLATAESCLGTPYRYAGIDRRGLDCSGLVFFSFKEGLNYSVPRSSEALYGWVEKINTEDLQIGDLVFFITTGPGISHVGIYAGEGRFIHSASEGPYTGVIYSRLDESYWKRTYKGAGRALPWDEAAAQAMAAPVNSSKKPEPGSKPTEYSGSTSHSSKDWKDPGFYAGFGAAWNWGGFFEGSPSIFRGVSALATAGFKGSKYRAGLEIRPVWDGTLGVFRLPFTLSFGTDYFQIFGGPAYTFGEPSLTLDGGVRSYSGGDTWLWEAGFSGSFPPIKLSRGILSIYGELAWQPYHWETGDFEFKPDVTANLRLSTGVRYFWHF